MIEKALSLKQPRAEFGERVAGELVAALRDYVRRFGSDFTVEVGMGILGVYAAYCGTRRGCLSLGEASIDSGVVVLDRPAAGIKEVTKEEVQGGGRGGFDAVSLTRYSVRDFGGGAVDKAIIEDAIRIARRSPSVCNRQGWRVHSFHDPAHVAAILNGQAGGGGFCVEDVGAVLVVTCDLGVFFSIGERHQAFVDGGMFAMSLLYALHYQGVGACCLNLCVEPRGDSWFRKVGGIPNNEALIVRIAVGNLRDRFRVACSARKAVSDILSVH